LQGNWQVRHQRLKERLVGDTRWDAFTGASAVWLTLGGLGTIDDNVMALPSGPYRGLGVRAFDPVSSTWSIWWIDGRTPAHIEAPVRGAFAGDGGSFRGRDDFEGRPIEVWFRWHDIHGDEPWWEQAFSDDAGAHWEVNWRNWFRALLRSPLRFRSCRMHRAILISWWAIGTCAIAACALGWQAAMRGTRSTAPCTTGRYWADSATWATT
jgi:hypothetical protein